MVPSLVSVIDIVHRIFAPSLFLGYRVSVSRSFIPYHIVSFPYFSSFTPDPPPSVSSINSTVASSTEFTIFKMSAGARFLRYPSSGKQVTVTKVGAAVDGQTRKIWTRKKTKKIDIQEEKKAYYKKRMTRSGRKGRWR